MNLNSIEILAAIIIIIAIVKISLLILNPKIWMSLIEKIYTKPAVITVLGFLLTLLVLYFIINSGVSIIVVLAVCLFVSLLMITGLATFADEIIAWIKSQDITGVIKRLWLYSAMWIFLIIWGAYALLYK